MQTFMGFSGSFSLSAIAPGKKGLHMTPNGTSSQKNTGIRLATFAVVILGCLALIAILYKVLPKVIASPNTPLPTETLTVSDNVQEQSGAPDLSANEQTDTDNNTPITIDMDDIYLNELGPVLDQQGRVFPNPTACVDTIWNGQDIIDYFGKDLSPAYLPKELSASPNNSTQNVVLSSEGEVWEDTVWLYFAHAFEEDGSRKLTDDVPAFKGFSLIASKIGIISEYQFQLTESPFLLPDYEPKVSKFGDIDVYIGYQSIGYGPYEARDGYYDYYVAIFKVADIEYQLAFSQIGLEEAVKVIASIIFETDNIVVTERLNIQAKTSVLDAGFLVLLIY